MARQILHVDMDAFFASLEAQRRSLEGEPLVVCVYSGRSEDSGAVSTCSYEAREIGIAAGIPISRAKRIASDTDEEVHFVPMDKEYYRHVSDRIADEVFADVTDTIEHASIDEAYLDVTDAVDGFDGATEVAERIQARIEDRFGLSCSVGVGPNKLVAKIASDQDKPSGMTVVRPESVEGFMWSLDLEAIHGIGPETAEELREMGIESVEELAEADRQRLVAAFGQRRGVKLRKWARGRDDRRVEERERQQISRLTTLETDTRIEDYIIRSLDELVSEVARMVEEDDFWFRTVVFLAIDTDMQMHTRSRTFETPVRGEEVLEEAIEGLLGRFLEEFDGQLRRVGVRVRNLEEEEGQKSLDDF